MIATLGFLLVTTSAAPRGTVLVPLPTPSEATVQVGADAIHLFSGFTLGSCGELVHYVRELGNVADSSFIKPFPGDPVRATSSAFVGIGWSNWSLISPGTTCYTRVRQDTGGTRFRYRKTGDVLVLMDTVFHAIVDTHSVSVWPYKAVVDVRSRWSHAPNDPKQKWVRWVDSIDFVLGKTIPTGNHPILTLIDSMAIDSIRPAKAAMGDPWNLRIDAVERSGRTWNFDLHSSPYRRPPANHGWGVVLPPGTTFRFQEWWEEGLSPRRNRVIHIWSKGKVIDSLIANPATHQTMDARRRVPRASRPSGVKTYDARGRRDREPAGVGNGVGIGPEPAEIEIRFGK